ncbi:hypothetical protein N9954_05400 [Maribacter sp.]|nr:hypothetical protein [Maribacter sp.]
MKKFNLLLEMSDFMTEDNSLVSELQLAENQPLNYLSQFARVLQERGIDKAIPELPWLALVDGLASRNLLEELDWKDDPEELIAVCLRLTENHSQSTEIKTSITSIEASLSDDIEEFLPVLNRYLYKHGIQLVWIDINSDSYPLTILASDKVNEAKRLALDAGYGTIKY